MKPRQIVILTLFLTSLGLGIALVPREGDPPRPMRGDQGNARRLDPVMAKVDVPPKQVEVLAGTLEGVIRCETAVPRNPPFVEQGDDGAKDAAVCAKSEIPDESLIVNPAAENGIENVVVFLPTRPPNYMEREPPAAETRQEIRGCRFIPHVLAVRVRQRILIDYKETIAHSVHVLPLRSRRFSQAIGSSSRQPQIETYDQTDPFPVEVRCDLHTWMKAYHVVTNHPFVAITDASGRFRIDGIPVGTHLFRIWHECAGILEKREVVIRPGQTAQLRAVYAASRF